MTSAMSLGVRLSGLTTGTLAWPLQEVSSSSAAAAAATSRVATASSGRSAVFAMENVPCSLIAWVWRSRFSMKNGRASAR